MKTPDNTHREKLPGPPHAPTFTVTVTPEGAAQAERANSAHCMWADSVRESIPEAEYVSVDLQTIRFTDVSKGLRYTYLTPRAVQESLIRFDNGVPWGDRPMTVRLRDGAVTRSSKLRTRKIPGMPEGQERKMVRPKDGSESSVPVVVGGRTPPLAPLGNFRAAAGKRRSYGLRGLSNWALEQPPDAPESPKKSKRRG